MNLLHQLNLQLLRIFKNLSPLFKSSYLIDELLMFFFFDCLAFLLVELFNFLGCDHILLMLNSISLKHILLYFHILFLQYLLFMFGSASTDFVGILYLLIKHYYLTHIRAVQPIFSNFPGAVNQGALIVLLLKFYQLKLLLSL